MSPKTKPQKLSFKSIFKPPKKYWTWAHVMHVTIFFFSLLFHNYLNTWHRVVFFFGVNMPSVFIIVKKLNMVCVFLLEKMQYVHKRKKKL